MPWLYQMHHHYMLATQHLGCSQRLVNPTGYVNSGIFKSEFESIANYTTAPITHFKNINTILYPG